MIRFVRRLRLAAFCALAICVAAPAFAQCGNQPSLKLSDGALACVARVGTTELTYSAGPEGAGPAATRKSKSQGGFVMLRMPNEASAKGLNRNTILRRARGVCAAYKDRILSEISQPSNLLMVVIFGWGPNPAPSAAQNRRSPTYRELYMTTSCRVKAEQ